MKFIQNYHTERNVALNQELGVMTGCLDFYPSGCYLQRMDFTRPWSEYTYVAFDTETSGAYPLGAEIVEFGAVKWRGEEIETYQTLLKPSVPMSDFIIGIHGITNAMVETAPHISEKIAEIRKFFDGAILMAHHAPFDMGFLAVDFEKAHLAFPLEPVLCTSLLARNVIHDSVNHKLQTLIGHLGLPQGQAHRALDDARACLQVGLECFRRIGDTVALDQVFKKMGKTLNWGSYSLLKSMDAKYNMVVKAVLDHNDLDIIYEGGSLKGQTRRVTPIGIVRNPDGDYVMATCHLDRAQKRFYLGKIKDLSIVHN